MPPEQVKLTDAERRVLFALEDVWQTVSEVGHAAREPKNRRCAGILRSLIRKGLAVCRDNHGPGTYEHGIAEYAITEEGDRLAERLGRYAT